MIALYTWIISGILGAFLTIAYIPLIKKPSTVILILIVSIMAGWAGLLSGLDFLIKYLTKKY